MRRAFARAGHSRTLWLSRDHMNIPASFDQLVLFLLFVLPGITFSTVRIAISGWRGPDYGVGARILEALFVSAIFNAVYLVLLGETLVKTIQSTTNLLDLVSTVRIVIVLVLLVGVPALVAILVAVLAHPRPEFYWGFTSRGRRYPRVDLRNNYRSTPQAWDFKVLNVGGSFVRVRTEDGTFYGGWYGGNSLASTYPNDRDLFIESQWKLDANGDFKGKIIGTRGVWIPITDKTIVEWVDPAPIEPTRGGSNDRNSG